MIQFGVAGNCDRFYDEGYKHSVQAPGFLAGLGLNAYEYAAGHGLALGETAARQIGDEARRNGISVSIHAPYYINLATPDPEKSEKNVGYLLDCARAVTWFGGTRIVFHPGSPGKYPRAEALARMTEQYAACRAQLDEAGFSHVTLCPETMGRPSQLGTLDEIISLCLLDTRAVPTLDFAHLHAASAGGLNSEAAFERVLTKLLDALGEARMKHFHSHFSRIAYTAKGEKMHMTFADEGYGPDFRHLMPVLRRYSLEPVIICESRGTQADDALAMQRISREGKDDTP